MTPSGRESPALATSIASWTAARAALKPRLARIYLHVQVSNPSARAFYERHGFTLSRVHENYYKKIEPRDAWVLELALDRLIEIVHWSSTLRFPSRPAAQTVGMGLTGEGALVYP